MAGYLNWLSVLYNIGTPWYQASLDLGLNNQTNIDISSRNWLFVSFRKIENKWKILREGVGENLFSPRKALTEANLTSRSRRVPSAFFLYGKKVFDTKEITHKLISKVHNMWKIPQHIFLIQIIEDNNGWEKTKRGCSTSVQTPPVRLL